MTYSLEEMMQDTFDEVADRITEYTLLRAIESSYDCARNLLDKQENGVDLQAHEEEDLQDAMKTLVALKVSYKYFTTTDKWKNVDQFVITI